MSEEICCLLCLERIADSTAQIDINSAEGCTLNLQYILEKYFKEELSSAYASMASRIICRPCWCAVFTFHEFCLRVQRAHLEATNVLHLSKELELKAETIKQEYDVDTETQPLAKRRRRGRPRRQIVLKTSVETPVLPECKVVLEKLNLADIDNKPHIQYPSVEPDVLLNNLHMSEVKHEALQEECLDADYSADGADFDYVPTALSPKDCLEDSEIESELEVMKPRAKTKKKDYSVKTKKMLEADEYIAKHFKLICCLCNRPLADFSELKTHFQAQHRTRGYVRCCGKKLVKRGVLVDHIHMHQDPDYFKCTRCGKSMSDRRCLEMHLKNHDLNHERIYKCDICPKSFFRQSILMRHVVTHMPNEQRKYACPQCDKTFPTNYIMNQHLKLVHLNMYAKICDVCGKSIKGREALRRHMDQHAGVLSAPIQCQLCNATLTNKYGLARHMKTMHTEEYQTPQTCPVCAKVSPSIQAQQHHMKYMHDMARKYECPLCDKAFKRSTDLKEHMTTHTGEVLYTCTFCPKTFNSNANMYSHRKKAHPNEWAQLRLQKYNAQQKVKSNTAGESVNDTLMQLPAENITSQ